MVAWKYSAASKTPFIPHTNKIFGAGSGNGGLQISFLDIPENLVFHLKDLA